MKGVIKVETSTSFYNNLEKEELGIKLNEKEFIETSLHFSKNQLGEFYKYEDIIVTIVGGKRYDILYEEKLYNKMCLIHE